MKRIIWFLLLLSAFCTLYAQNSMPRYNIRCEREGVYFGDIKVELFPLVAPLHTRNFDSLVAIQFYDSTAFHRVVPNFVIQGGDPNSRHGDPSTWGNGDPSQVSIPAEFSAIVHARGIIGAARDANINSANSQFYINLVENSSLNGLYTAYGRVYDGLAIVDTIANAPLVAGTSRPQKKITMFVTSSGSSNTVPAIPSLVAPVNGQSDVTAAVNFEWSAVQGAVLYRIQVAKDSLFNNIVYDKNVGRNSVIPPAFEQGLLKHYWRVSSNNGGNISANSMVRSFITGIASPSQILPADSATGMSTSPAFSWRRVAGASSYRIQIATTPGFFGVGLVMNQIVNDTAFTASNLLADKRYYWRVKGITPTYEGSYSSTRTFLTLATSTEIREERYEYSLSANFPNPFSGKTNISYSIPELTNVQIKLFDNLGRELKNIMSEVKVTGQYNLEINCETYPSGIYLVEMRTNQFRRTQKIILIR